MHIQALYPAHGILPGSSSKLRLLVINLASVPGGQLVNSPTAQNPDRNLKASVEELKTLNSTSALEKTNVLMKLRETLLDSGEKTKVTVPPGLVVYPNNTLWAILMSSAFFAGFGAFISMPYRYEKSQKARKNKNQVQNDSRIVS